MASALATVRVRSGQTAGFDERRQEQRILVDDMSARVRIGEGTESWPAKVLDISTTGLRLRLNSPLTVGTETTVSFERTVAIGEVRYCRPGDAKSFEIGLRLTDALNVV